MKTNELKRLAAADDDRARELASRVEAEAAGRGLLDVAVAPVGSPIGELLVAVTPRGLVRVAFAEEDRDGVLAEDPREIRPGSWSRRRPPTRSAASWRSSSPRGALASRCGSIVG